MNTDTILLKRILKTLVNIETHVKAIHNEVGLRGFMAEAKKRKHR